MDEAEDVSRLTLAAYLCYQDGGSRGRSYSGPRRPRRSTRASSAAANGRLKERDQHLDQEPL